MPHLSPRDRELVAIGAAMGSNCVPCIEYHIPKAREAGVSDSEIAEAIRLSDRVRQVPARKVTWRSKWQAQPLQVAKPRKVQQLGPRSRPGSECKSACQGKAKLP